jgi:predicted nucleic acid-binding protein
LRQFDAFFTQFAETWEVPYRQRSWTQSVGIMALRQLRSLDAIHVAIAQDIGVTDFATTDDHFRRIGGLRVWLLRDQPT